jgi:hypothetical protein
MSERPRSLELDVNSAEIWELAGAIDGFAHAPNEDRGATPHSADERIYVTDKNISGKDVQYWLGWLPQSNDQYGVMVGILYPNGSIDDYSLHSDGRIFHLSEDNEDVRGKPIAMYTYMQQMHGAMISGRPDVTIAVADKDNQ